MKERKFYNTNSVLENGLLQDIKIRTGDRFVLQQSGACLYTAKPTRKWIQFLDHQHLCRSRVLASKHSRIESSVDFIGPLQKKVSYNSTKRGLEVSAISERIFVCDISQRYVNAVVDQCRDSLKSCVDDRGDTLNIFFDL